MEKNFPCAIGYHCKNPYSGNGQGLGHARNILPVVLQKIDDALYKNRTKQGVV